MAFNIIRTNKIRDSMLAHMKQKYGMDFIAQSLILRGISDDKDVLICHAAGSDAKRDCVTVNRWGEEGRYTFGDTYFSIKIRPEVENIFIGICRELLLDAVVKYMAKDFFDESFDQHKKYTDLVSSRQCRHMSVTVIIKVPDGCDASVINNTFEEKVMQTIFKGACKQYYLKQAYFDALNDDNMYEMLYEKNGYLVYRSNMVCLH